ncbi:MAG TPA: DUF3883 domain-containing protein [Bryobacteraceae bacterium]|nr:DUF3883 domain-containing protein [Bryobacteraceae bacterium]
MRAEIEAARGTRIWTDYVNALKLISQVVFTRSSAFILELLQNAEDSGLGLNSTGTFDIALNRRRIKVSHNGSPFAPADVRALCGIQSSKKPERGTLGYLGIGFKSVFTATDSPEIYSRGFAFKFDRGAWDDPGAVPWHIIPLWIDQPSEEIDSEKTTIVIPFRDEGHYDRISAEVQKLKTDLYLFLRWLKRITFKDEVSGQAAVIENLGEIDGITRLRHNDKEQRFLFFRRTIKAVPDSVKLDRLTQEYRANVNQREISVGFALNDQGDIAPMEAGAMYGGVYSFMPLGEAKSGAKFPIQADFLVQPGRDAINYEAPWNRWLLGEIMELCKSAIRHFAAHERWKFQFLPAFEFARSPGLESYAKMFRPGLIDPLEQFLRQEPLIPAAQGDAATLDRLVRITESDEAIAAFNLLGVLPRAEIAAVFSGEPDKVAVHPQVREGPIKRIRNVDRWDFLKNRPFLESRAGAPGGPAWYGALYRWLRAQPFREAYFYYTTKWRTKGYHDHEIVLASDLTLRKGGDVSVLELPTDDGAMAEFAVELQGSRLMLHPDVLAAEPPGDNSLRNFLKGLLGVQALDARAVGRDAILPRIRVQSLPPGVDDLIRLTRYAKQLLGQELGSGTNIWVLTKSGEIRRASEVLPSRALHPVQDWETNQHYVTGLNFVADAYFDNTDDETIIRPWREFFKAAGVKDTPDKGVEEFAMHYAEQEIGMRWTNVTPVENRNLGYDLEADDDAGRHVQIEVKGLSQDGDVNLSPNETLAADTYRESLYVCVVTGIPEQPAMFLVRDPALNGRKERITVPADVWRSHRW